MSKQVSFKARVISNASKVMTKSNGSEYVLLSVQLLDGPAAGNEVTATMTTLNRDGVVKAPSNKGDNVVVHWRSVADSKNPGKYINFFDIGSDMITTDNDVITALLGINVEESQAI